MKVLCGFTCIATVVCLFAALGASARGGSEAKKAVLKVSIRATVTKSWNTVAHTTVDGCGVSIHSIGVRKVVLRSKRPTKVVVTAGGGRASYAPPAVRFVSAEATGSGEQTTKFEAPCQPRAEHVNCPRARKVTSGATFRFFRSKRNEIAFKAARLPDVPGSCPRQSAAVFGIRPGLHQASGQLSEAALTNRRVPAQTALASADVES